MLSSETVFTSGMSMIHGKDFNISLIEFPLVHPDASHAIKSKYGEFLGNLRRKFADLTQNDEVQGDRICKWTIEIMWREILSEVIDFNDKFKSALEGHSMVFVCLDTGLLPYQQDLLKRSYVDSTFFEFDTTCANNSFEKIYNYLSGNQSNQIVRSNILDYSYPLLLHANSTSSGLVFNYYYSYLNRQVGSTNNIFLTFTFKKDVSRESFPNTILVQLDTLVESVYLNKCPSTVPAEDFEQIQSNPLVFVFDPLKYRVFDGTQTVATFFVAGVPDFGHHVKKISVWQENLELDSLISIQLKDDVRHWIAEYQPCSRADGPSMAMFEERNNPTRHCHFFARAHAPPTATCYGGISTMRKTTTDCFNLYKADPKNANTKDDKRIARFRLAPVYYILALSSCNFGPPDTDTPTQCGETHLKGTITDPNEPERINLAYANGEVLQSPMMLEYNRYLRRTFYYVDETAQNGEITRYLFCAEYPYILSVLHQMERIKKITNAQKRDEYLRFCNMLNRILVIDGLCESIKLIQFDDEDISDEFGYSDSKTLSQQIIEDIDQWYETPDPYASSLFIAPKILQSERAPRVMFFFAESTRENPMIMSLIKDLQEKLESHGYLIDDADSNLASIEGAEQVIFICTGGKDEDINRRMMEAVKRKANKRGVMHDVFILVNDAIRYFPCRFIQSVPYLTFDLDKRSAQLEDHEVQDVIYYLNNMNILSKAYTNIFENTSRPVQQQSSKVGSAICSCEETMVTSVGAGCAGAFYFNYAKLLVCLTDHKLRVQAIGDQLCKENLLNSDYEQATFINKWVFVIPWTIQNSSQLLSYGLSLNENEQQAIGLKLTVWKSPDPEFSNPNLWVTVGGIYRRSYSALSVYKLTRLSDEKTFYFPMEIPAALHGLQNQYQNILSHFNFGAFNPSEQAVSFREKIEEYTSNDTNADWHQDIVLVPLGDPCMTIENHPHTSFEHGKVLLKTLWQRLSLFVLHVH